MNIQQILEQDPRIVEIKQKIYSLYRAKASKILELSHLEADLIKLQGSYETVGTEIVKKLKGVNLNPSAADTVTEPPVIEPEGETPIAEENNDDGFAEATEPDVIPPTAENINPSDNNV